MRLFFDDTLVGTRVVRMIESTGKPHLNTSGGVAQYRVASVEKEDGETFIRLQRKIVHGKGQTPRNGYEWQHRMGERIAADFFAKHYRVVVKKDLAALRRVPLHGARKDSW